LQTESKDPADSGIVTLGNAGNLGQGIARDNLQGDEMGNTGQAAVDSTGAETAPASLPDDLTVHSTTPETPAVRVNWLFSGVLLGAGGWLLVLGVIFAAVGSWIVASALLGGFVLCTLGVLLAGSRLRSVHDSARSELG
jgi:hypothetical protein